MRSARRADSGPALLTAKSGMYQAAVTGLLASTSRCDVRRSVDVSRSRSAREVVSGGFDVCCGAKPPFWNA